jgi:hypothetical protein
MGKFRTWLYMLARILGDVQAVRKGKVGRRIARCAAGKDAGRILGRSCFGITTYFKVARS